MRPGTCQRSGWYILLTVSIIMWAVFKNWPSRGSCSVPLLLLSDGCSTMPQLATYVQPDWKHSEKCPLQSASLVFERKKDHFRVRPCHVQPYDLILILLLVVLTCVCIFRCRVKSWCSARRTSRTWLWNVLSRSSSIWFWADLRFRIYRRFHSWQSRIRRHHK